MALCMIQGRAGLALGGPGAGPPGRRRRGPPGSAPGSAEHAAAAGLLDLAATSPPAKLLLAVRSFCCVATICSRQMSPLGASRTPCMCML